jgi:hypothetical protein
MAAPQLTVGPRSLADGSLLDPRGAKTGEAVVQQAHGKYYEATHRGKCFAGMTAVAGVSVANLAQGTTGPITLANPAGSGKRLSILRANMGYVSGTMPAGNLTYSVNTNPAAAAVTGTAITPVCLDIGSGIGPTAKLFTTSTLPAAPTPIRNFANLDANLATSTNNPYNIVDDVDGSIVLEPGTSLTISGTTAAGSSPLVAFGLEWEEIDIV